MRMKVYVYSNSMITVLTNNKFIIQNHNFIQKIFTKTWQYASLKN